MTANHRKGVILSPVAADGIAWIASFPIARAIDGDVAKGTRNEPTATITAYCYSPTGASLPPGTVSPPVDVGT